MTRACRPIDVALATAASAAPAACAVAAQSRALSVAPAVTTIVPETRLQHTPDRFSTPAAVAVFFVKLGTGERPLKSQRSSSRGLSLIDVMRRLTPTKEQRWKTKMRVTDPINRKGSSTQATRDASGGRPGTVTERVIKERSKTRYVGRFF